MNSKSALQVPCGESVRGLTVDRIIARLRAANAEGARIVNLRCAAAVPVGCDDLALPPAIGAGPEGRIDPGR